MNCFIDIFENFEPIHSVLGNICERLNEALSLLWFNVTNVCPFHPTSFCLIIRLIFLKSALVLLLSIFGHPRYVSMGLVVVVKVLSGILKWYPFAKIRFNMFLGLITLKRVDLSSNQKSFGLDDLGLIQKNPKGKPIFLSSFVFSKRHDSI